MNILLIDNGTSLLKKLQDLIPGSEVTQRWNMVTREEGNFDLIVLSGGSAFPVRSKESESMYERDLIRTFKGPIVGICFGAEIIADTYGGKLVELPEKIKGLREVNILKDEPYFMGRNIIHVYESHEWAIASLPEEFEVLATSKSGIEAFKHKERPLYGFQFHPENMIEQGDGDEIFLALLNILSVKL